MAQLAQADLAGVLGFVGACEEFTDFDSLRAGLLREIRPLIPYDSAVYMEVVPGTPESPARRLRWTFEPEESAAVAPPEAYERWEHQHPVIAWYRTHAGGPALRLSDFMRSRDVHRLELYDEFLRPAGIEHQMSITFRLSRHEAIGLPLNRADRPFSDRERDVLDLLRPHIVRVHRRLRERAWARGAARALDEAGRAVVLLDRGGGIESATGSAQAWLREYFADRPSMLDAWIEQRTTAPLVAQRNGSRLVVRFVPGEPDALVLEERHDGLPGERMGSLGLTPRECEVLRCVDRGLTGVQIGLELAVSTRTVQKHLEHVYAKLGVPTRTAALAKARAGQ
jgi:DNA-binding CsgD family transcriptional regulator